MFGCIFHFFCFFFFRMCFSLPIAQYGSTLSDTTIMCQIFIRNIDKSWHSPWQINELRLQDGFTLIFSSIYWIVSTVRQEILPSDSWQWLKYPYFAYHTYSSHVVFLPLLYTNRINFICLKMPNCFFAICVMELTSHGDDRENVCTIFSLPHKNKTKTLKKEQ